MYMYISILSYILYVAYPPTNLIMTLILIYSYVS